VVILKACMLVGQEEGASIQIFAEQEWLW